mmetsp:Transcript_18445/g.16314  ORF Transcript_18445/g.16314 Transcript_18445/m.16314 type:complete len:135 (+) Transcript_18445:2-406(+)
MESKVSDFSADLTSKMQEVFKRGYFFKDTTKIQDSKQEKLLLPSTRRRQFTTIKFDDYFNKSTTKKKNIKNLRNKLKQLRVKHKNDGDRYRSNGRNVDKDFPRFFDNYRFRSNIIQKLNHSRESDISSKFYPTD